MNKEIILSVIITAIIFGGGGYYFGAKLSSSKISQPQNFRGARTGGGFITGQIIAKDATSITVQMNSGSKIIFYSGSTQIAKSVSGTSNDLTIGEQITANGTANSDGSITAQTIQIRPKIQGN